MHRRTADSPSDILHPKDVAAMCGRISLTTIWRMRRRGQFPEPVQLSPGRKGWRRIDIERWLSERASSPVEAA